jgi:hypothetical protein
MRKLFGALAVVGLALATGQAAAQERFGGLTGTVTDQSGGVLPGATVHVTSKVTDTVRSVLSGSDGAYSLLDLDPGHYAVRFELNGFSSSQVDDINVLLGRVLRLNAQLQVGNLSETLTVTAGAVPNIDLRTTTVAHNVTAEEFDRLPKARSFQSLAMTAPSVNSGEIEGGFQVNGASGAENSFTVDGVVTNSLVNGRSRQDTVFEYLQEVQIKTTGISAEFGGALGGVISAVTKSGGNTTRGEVHYYYEGSSLRSNPVERLVLDPADDVSVSYVQDSKPPDHRNELGGSIGGPLVRDRLFYFASASPRLRRQTNDFLFSNGTESGQISRDIDYQQLFGKLTYSGNRTTAHWSGLWTPISATGTLPAYDGTAANVLASSLAGNQVNLNRGYDINQVNTSGTVDVTLTNTSFLSVRGGFFHDNYEDKGIPDTTAVIYNLSSIGLAGIPASLQAPVGTQNTPRALITSYDTTRRGFFNADYNRAFTAGGTHTLKGGIGYQRTSNDVSSAYPGGYVLLNWGVPFSFGGVDQGTGAYGYYEVNDRGVKGKVNANIISLYVQDQWTVGDRLTISLGLRSENETIPSFRQDIKDNAFQFGFGDKIAPRLGASYDLKGDGKAKLYGSWGRYYDWTKYELARGSFGADSWCVYYRGLDTLDINSLSLSNMPGADLWTTPGSCRDRRVPNFETVDPAIKPMSQDSTSVGFELELTPRSTLTLHYVHNNLNRTIEDLGALVDGNEVYYIANPGEGGATSFPTSSSPLTPSFATPKAKRQYDAFEIGVNRRFANNFFWSANYTISRLYGNYSGLASSDEIHTPTTGVSSATAQQQAGSISRPGSNVNRAWDLEDLLFDASGNLDPRGRLATDRPHVVKLYGAYQFDFGTQLGLFFYGGSGTPMTTYVNTANQTEVMVNGRGDMGRTPALTRTDFLLSHELDLTGGRRIRLELNVLNLFNQKTARHLFNNVNRGAGLPRGSAAADLSNVNLSQGYDYNALILASPEGAGAYDPRYGQPDLFEDGARGQFLVKFLF